MSKTKIREELETALDIIVEFKDQASKIAGSEEFLDGHIGSLQSGLSRLDDLDTAEKWALLEGAHEMLGIVADENEKATFVPGSALRGAIIRGLRNEIGAAIRGLDD